MLGHIVQLSHPDEVISRPELFNDIQKLHRSNNQLQHLRLGCSLCPDVTRQQSYVNLRLQPDFLESNSFSGDLVLGFVNHSIRPFANLFHLLKRIHCYLEKVGTGGLLIVQLVSKTRLFVCELTTVRWQTDVVEQRAHRHIINCSSGLVQPVRAQPQGRGPAEDELSQVETATASGLRSFVSLGTDTIR